MKYPQKAGQPASTKLLNRGELYWPAVTMAYGRCQKIGDKTFTTRAEAKREAARILKAKAEASL